MTQSLSPTLAVGVIVRAHGIRGEVKIQPLTDQAEDWLSLHAVEWTDRQGARVCRRVKHQRLQGSMVIAQLEGVYDRNAAETLRETELRVPRGQAPQLEQDRYYIVDLIGCQVEDETGAQLGQVTEVHQPGGNDVYEIHGNQGVYLMPAIRQVIREVDVKQRRILVDSVRFSEVAVHED